MAKVRDTHGRVVFQGRNEDSEEFVKTHFPHHHVQPPGNAVDEPSTSDVVIEYDEVKAEVEEEVE